MLFPFSDPPIFNYGKSAVHNTWNVKIINWTTMTYLDSSLLLKRLELSCLFNETKFWICFRAFLATHCGHWSKQSWNGAQSSCKEKLPPCFWCKIRRFLNILKKFSWISRGFSCVEVSLVSFFKYPSDILSKDSVKMGHHVFHPKISNLLPMTSLARTPWSSIFIKRVSVIPEIVSFDERFIFWVREFSTLFWRSFFKPVSSSEYKWTRALSINFNLRTEWSKGQKALPFPSLMSSRASKLPMVFKQNCLKNLKS